MVKQSFPSEYDQHDEKVFRESLGSFGTTTKPGENQLKELQTKVRQGVRHVELHLAGEGKGQFNVQDVPDKYGFEQRRTIMQLAKLNNQTLSVHGTFNVNSFAGLSNGGFEEWQRSNNIKEIDETVKFAAETAKGGAVVFHLHETQLRTPPGEINLPQQYLKKLKADERKRIEETYLQTDNFQRMFQDNPNLPNEMKVKYRELEAENTKEFRKFKETYADELAEHKGEEWKVYYNKDYIERLKNTDQSLVVVGNSLSRVNRNEQILNTDSSGKISLKEKAEALSNKELKYLQEKGISDPSKLQLGDFQKFRSLLLNGKGSTGEQKEILKSLKKKYLWKYDDMLKDKLNMRYEADKDFFELQNRQQIAVGKLQQDELKTLKDIHKEAFDNLEELEAKRKHELDQLRKISDKIEKTEKPASEDLALKDLLRSKLLERNQEIENVKFRAIGQTDYSQLSQFDEKMAQLDEQITELEKKNENAKVLTDEIFYKNASAMGDLGLKAAKYQLDLKSRSKVSEKKLKEINKEIREIEKKLEKTDSADKRTQLHNELQKKKYETRKFVGVKDYDDIDLEKAPLYLAPENIMAGYGYMDSLEEYKAVIRESWDQFAEKLLSDEKDYKAIREAYEKELSAKEGKKVKIDSKQAFELAKRHIGGTFDNAHAGVWLKYFKKKEGESEEERIGRFNKWLNTEAEGMVREGIIKHIHFNDTQAKDDDHNLLGQGVLDIHDWRERLRKAGVQEALIVEAGGRGAADNLHLLNAFDIFNPTISTRLDGEVERSYGFNEATQGTGQGISDWISVRRSYDQRQQYSDYGMSYSSFRHQAPKNDNSRGGWSGTGFF